MAVRLNHTIVHAHDKQETARHLVDILGLLDGGRGLYWNDPNGHRLEILTVPYGGWGR